jgi:DNA-binding HxlR family transcriptional regulator
LRYTAGVLGKDYDRQDCAIARALEVIGERWTLLIVRDAFHGVRRFKDFQEHLDIPRAVLADRLIGLVDEGVLERLPDPRHAGRHQYTLTAAGRDLWPVLHSLLAWGGRHRAHNSIIFLHAACGTVLDEHGACPVCGVTPGPEDIESERRPGHTPLRADAVSRAIGARHRLMEPIEA